MELVEGATERVEHALAETPATLDSIDARLARVENTLGTLVARVLPLVDAAEAFAHSPMGKMIGKKAAKE